MAKSVQKTDHAKGANDYAIAWQKEVESLSGPKAVRAWQQKLRADLPTLIGKFPARKPAVPPAQVKGRIERPDCIIEKIIFESQPGFYVTANLYVPRERAKRCPAVLFTCGHSSNGKAYPHYHACCLGLAGKGYVVLNYDPLGQGERSQFIQGRNVWPVTATVAQHNAVARPSFLLGRTLLLFRIWDGIRALDYLLSRPEVDPVRIGVVGNSGGGEMAQLLAAVDERIRVCASCSPGGSCESIYLTGVYWPRIRLVSLIPPRPFLIQWGQEEARGVAVKDFVPSYLRCLYAKLGVDAAVYTASVRADGVADHSTHSLERTHREPVYAWLNRWLGNESAGKVEGRIQAEPEERLLCTATGQVLLDFPGAESTHTLNRAYLERIAVRRREPRSRHAAETALDNIRATVRNAFGITPAGLRPPPDGGVKEIVYRDKYRIEKAVLAGDDGVTLRALLYLPQRPVPSVPVIFASEFGKDYSADLPCQLATAGIAVLSLDVRHIGPAFFADGRRRVPGEDMGYNADIYTHDRKLIDAAGTGQAMVGRQTGDVLRALDWLTTRAEFAGRGVSIIGEGIGGLWALLAAAFDQRVVAAVAWKTLASLRSLVEEPYYAYFHFHSYFWFPGILRELDIPDLACLAVPKPCLFLDAFAADANVLSKLAPASDWRRVAEFYRLLGARGRFAYARSGRQPGHRIQLLREFLQGAQCRKHAD